MTKKAKIRVPQEVREDKPEEERKLRVLGDSWKDKAAKLDQIFNYVAAQKSHFVTLDAKLHTDDFDKELAKASELPVHTRPLRRRYYWATRELDGYKDGDSGKAEVRTEQKLGKGYWEQVLKLGGSAGKKKTLKRGEFKRALDAFGTNLGVYEGAIKKGAKQILGEKQLKPLIIIEGQSKPMLYHPDGRDDVLFEIKFDKCKGFTFDGHEEDVVEVEIEVKEMPATMCEDELEALLDKSENMLCKAFSNDLESVYDAKPTALFNHLVKWRENDQKGFEKAYKALPGDKWQTWSP